MRLRRLSILVAALVPGEVVLVISLDLSAAPVPGGSRSASRRLPVTASVTVEPMLRGARGVVSVVLDHDKEVAIITYSEDKTNAGEVLKVVRETGTFDPHR